MCEYCKSDSKLYLNTVIADELISKATGLSEISQIARAELRLRKFLELKWNRRKKQAIEKAVSMAKKLEKHGKISKSIGTIMNQWAVDVTKTFNAEIANVYKLARKAGYKKASGKTKASLQFNVVKTHTMVNTQKAEIAIDFDLIDEGAMEAFSENNVFWIGEHYNKNISDSIRDVTKEVMIEAGASPKVAGRLMAEAAKKKLEIFSTPGGFHGTEKQYFEGLTANAMTVGRVYGQLRSFAQIGVTKYTIVNPGGSRICDVCAAVVGKAFTIQQGLDQISKEFKAKKPEDIKNIHPWTSDVSLVSGKSASSLSAAGFSLPPYHFKCRCTIDVEINADEVASLVPMEFPVR